MQSFDSSWYSKSDAAPSLGQVLRCRVQCETWPLYDVALATYCIVYGIPRGGGSRRVVCCAIDVQYYCTIVGNASGGMQHNQPQSERIYCKGQCETRS